MAAAAAQNQGMLNNQNDPTVVKWANQPLFGDVPTEDGMLRIERGLQWLSSLSRGGSNLGANVERTDPGAGGGGNATVQQQHADRNQAARQAVLSLIEPTSDLYRECSNAPFTDGADIWAYLPTRVYLRIQDDEAQSKIREAQQWTVRDLPVDKQDEMQCLHFKAKILAYNPMRHPNMNITHQQKLTIFCNGLHPEAKIIALQMKNNLAQAQANGCCFPAVYPVGHPQAGVAHPQANQLSLDALAMHVHRDFTTKLRAGIFRLKGQPGAAQLMTDNDGDDGPVTDLGGMASALPVPGQDAYVYASLHDAAVANYSEIVSYAINILQRPSATLRTCKNCGGVNHFSHRDGVLICPTAENSVPVDLLRRIRYPFGITPWRFGGRGKGKGKGIGKGKGGGKGGRGRGGYWVWQDEPDTESGSPDHDDAANQGQYITDDFDGWNN
jgi:hypothetical protein